jgi:hypothetical protein
LQLTGDRGAGVAERIGDHIERANSVHVCPPLTWPRKNDAPRRASVAARISADGVSVDRPPTG